MSALIAALTQWLRLKEGKHKNEDEQESFDDLLEEVEELGEQVAEHEKVLAAIRQKGKE